LLMQKQINLQGMQFGKKTVYWSFGNTISRGFFVQFLHGTDVRFRSKADIATGSRACR
jgi:hypothetical protein